MAIATGGASGAGGGGGGGGGGFPASATALTKDNTGSPSANIPLSGLGGPGLLQFAADGTPTKATGVADFDTLAYINSTVAPFMAARDATLVKMAYWAPCSRLGGELAVGLPTSSGAVYLVPGVGAKDWVTRVESGTTISSVRVVRTPNATAGSASAFQNLVANCRTTKYGLWIRCRPIAITATAGAPIANITDEATADSYVGFVGATSTTNFSSKIGAAAAQDTGVALGAPGTIHDIYWINDGTNIKSYFNDSASAATSGASLTAANAAGHWQANGNNGATAANCGFDVLGVAVFVA